MSEYVLDASAVLALLNGEPDGDQVEKFLPDSVISAVNASEVLSKLVDAGMPVEEAVESFNLLGIEVLEFTKEHAERSASIHKSTRGIGLSLGDRCCLALGRHTGFKVITADRRWTKARGCSVKIIR